MRLTLHLPDNVSRGSYRRVYNAVAAARGEPLYAAQAEIDHVPVERIEHWKLTPERVYSTDFYLRRTPAPRVCTQCGKRGKHHWHHVDTTLLPALRDLRAKIDIVDCIVTPLQWDAVYAQYLAALSAYYTVPVSETQYLCPLHHRARHSPAESRDEPLLDAETREMLESWG